MDIALCPELPDPANGMVTLTGTSVADTATYTCNAGFQLAGAPVLTCQGGGTWDNPLPRCQSLAGMKLYLLTLVELNTVCMEHQFALIDSCITNTLFNPYTRT